jgi:hypothetical protein
MMFKEFSKYAYVYTYVMFPIKSNHVYPHMCIYNIMLELVHILQSDEMRDKKSEHVPFTKRVRHNILSHGR